MSRPTAASSEQDLVTEVTCPHCEQLVEVSVPNREVEPTVKTQVAAFGEHSVVHCSVGHRFWVYYC
jgi:hypothetical protein